MKPKTIELLAFDRDHQLQYEGKCKLRIDRLSKMLLVEPENEEYKMKSAMFKWNFVVDKSIIFVFGEHELSDFALVFDEEKRCKKVYDFIVKDKAQSIGREILYSRFLYPICDKISSDAASELKIIIMKWIDKYDGKEKEEYIKLLKEKNIFDSIYSTNLHKDKDSDKIGDTVFCNASGYRENCLNRKRRCSQSDNSGNLQNSYGILIPRKKRKIMKTYPLCIDQNRFKIVSTKKGVYRRLLLFTVSENSHCYEYGWSCKKNLYFCRGCSSVRKDRTANLDKDENGLECIKTEDKKHACTPIPYIPENYTEMKIIKKPDYEILENCNTASGTALIIFDENDKSKCWEFRSVNMKHSYMYKCRHCNTLSKLLHVNTDNEYVELRDASHKCKLIPYEPSKYYQFKDFVLLPDFEIQTVTTMNGKEKKKLIVFDKNDRSLCYVYFKDGNYFRCGSCHSKKGIYAKLLKNSDGEDYVMLSTRKHICELRSYSEVSTKQIILRPPAFELMENTENGVNKLFIFESNDRSLCYVFSQVAGKNRYQCYGCNGMKSSRRISNPIKQVYAKLSNSENGEYIVHLNDTSHSCKPRRYEPEKYAKKEIQKCYDFFFFRQKRFLTSINVAIYHPENKKLCFKLLYSKSKSYFQCQGCTNIGKCFTTKLVKDEHGEEYFNFDFTKHACQPFKVSSVQGPNFVTLKRNKIVLERKKRLPESDESKIIKYPNFVVGPNSKGVEDASLFIFHDKDRNLGYRYYYSNSEERYKCNKRNLFNCNVFAKIQTGEDDEKYIVLGPSEHKCELVKYEKVDVYEEKIINASNFVTFSAKSNEKITKIIVFTTATRDECYEFGVDTTRISFSCLGCRKKNKFITVKLNKDESGQEYLQMSNQEHECQPRKYVKEKYEPKKIIPNELFELHPNINGEVDKRIIIFTSAEKDYFYEYSWIKSRGSFWCVSCMSIRKWVPVKLKENDNGEKYVECGEKTHVCQPRKYENDECDPKRIISAELFELHPNTKGEANKRLIIFISVKKDFVYEYRWVYGRTYFCISCKKLKTNVAAKIWKDKNGQNCFKLSERDHICKPRKYDPKKYRTQ